MKLTVLTENVAGGECLAEHGLSYLIEHNNQQVLFDTGHSDVFMKNAEKLSVNIHEDVKTVVLSHGHWDHGNGLSFLSNKTLITHPKSFINRYRENDNSTIGLKLSKEELEERFKLITSKKPYSLSNNIIFLGQIPRINTFEAQTTAFIDDQGNPDFVPDDSALAIIQNNELIIITGCSHSGICNIIDYAVKVTGISAIKAVIGGFHLKRLNQQTHSTVQFLKSINVGAVYPSHCTELPALALFYTEFRIEQIKTGTILEF